jgi:hypothetical protein
MPILSHLVEVVCSDGRDHASAMAAWLDLGSSWKAMTACMALAPAHDGYHATLPTLIRRRGGAPGMAAVAFS